MDEKIITTTIEHQNNLIINNSTNNNNKENNSSLAGSEVSIISGKNDNKHNHHQSNEKSDKTFIGKDNLNEKTLKDKCEDVMNKNCNSKNKLNNNINGMSPYKMSQISTNNLIPVEMKNKIPHNILMGIIQLILSITMVALGCLILAREATFANAGSGLWAGGIAAITGSLGIINMPRSHTAFLAMSLICVASSTLALALTGIGVVRDSNLIHEKSVSAVTAGSGLLFILTIHFFISVFSVYYSTLKLCTRQFPGQDDQEVVIANNTISQKKVEEYIKSITQQQKNGIYNTGTLISTNEKGGFFAKPMDKRTSWVGVDNLSNLTYTSAPPHYAPYPIMLVPTRNSMNKVQIMPMFPPPFIPGPGMLPPEMQIVPPPPPHSIGYDMQFYNRSFQKNKLKRQKSQKSVENTIQEHHKTRRTRRRKSEGDLMNNREALLYTGLDRAIAEDFLAQQEKHNHNEKYSPGDVAL